MENKQYIKSCEPETPGDFLVNAAVDIALASTNNIAKCAKDASTKCHTERS